MSVVMLAIFCTMVGIALQYPAQARFMPLVVGLPGIALCLVQVVLEVAARRRAAGGPAQASLSAASLSDTSEMGGAPDNSAAEDTAGAQRREIVLWCTFFGLITSLILIGFWATIPLFLLGFLRFYSKESWGFSIALSVAGTTVLALVFHFGLGVVLHQGFLLEPLLDQWLGT